MFRRFDANRVFIKLALATIFLLPLIAYGVIKLPAKDSVHTNEMAELVRHDNTTTTTTTTTTIPPPPPPTSVIWPQPGQVALTFDDGPHPTYTPAILDILSTYDIKATFYMLGQNMEQHPEIIRVAHDSNHSIQNHTWSHPYLSWLSDQQIVDELVQNNNFVRDLLGVSPRCFRPPYGDTNDRVRRVGFENELWENLWTSDTRDFEGRDPGNLVANMLSSPPKEGEGWVVLMHDGGGPRETTVQALPAIIENFINEGYEFVTLCDERYLTFGT